QDLAFVVALVLGEPTRRPIRLRRIAAARTVEGGNVLQRDQDVAVQLDLGAVVDGAVRGEPAVLVNAGHPWHFALLALVLARVVLHVSERSRSRLTKRASLSYVPLGAVLVRSRCGLRCVASEGNYDLGRRSFSLEEGANILKTKELQAQLR